MTSLSVRSQPLGTQAGKCLYILYRTLEKFSSIECMQISNETGKHAPYVEVVETILFPVEDLGWSALNIPLVGLVVSCREE